MHPRSNMTDVDLAIINSAKEYFPNAPICTRFFHLSQVLYRKIQFLGLQNVYNDPNATEVKYYTYMIAALAFVSIGDVKTMIRHLKASAPKSMDEFIKYF